MSDIRLAAALRRHPKWIRLRARLGAEGQVALVALWLFASEHRTSGLLEGMDDVEVELAAEWPEERRGELVEVLTSVRWLDRLPDGTLTLHEWAEHQPWLAGAEARRAGMRAKAVSRWAKRSGMTVEQYLAQGRVDAPRNAPRNAVGNAPSPSPSPSPSPTPSPGGARSRAPEPPQDSPSAPAEPDREPESDPDASRLEDLVVDRLEEPLELVQQALEELRAEGLSDEAIRDAAVATTTPLGVWAWKARILRERRGPSRGRKVPVDYGPRAPAPGSSGLEDRRRAQLAELEARQARGDKLGPRDTQALEALRARFGGTAA